MQRSGDGSSPSLVATAHQARPASVPGPTHTVRAVDVHTEHKIKLGPSGAVKRPYDCRTMTPDGFAGAVGAEPLTSQAAARAEQQSPIGLSPRKKPRKQTHVVAEGESATCRSPNSALVRFLGYLEEEVYLFENSYDVQSSVLMTSLSR